MTQEEKARAYDEALEKARERYIGIEDSVLGLNIAAMLLAKWMEFVEKHFND